jgi:hypothetical protein
MGRWWPITIGSGRGIRHSDPEHVTAAKVLRRKRIGVVRPVPEPDMELRRLTEYDTALGLGEDSQVGVAWCHHSN